MGVSFRGWAVRFRSLKSFLAAACLAPLAVSGPVLAGSAVKVAVSIAPQKYFVQKVGGRLAEVTVMVPPGASPATYEPRPRQMAALSEAKVYFALGLPFEKAWLPKMAAANRDMTVVHTEAQVERRAMASRTGQGRGGSDSPDPHIWLSPPLVKIQAAAIREGLIKADPAHKAVYERNYAAFEAELIALDEEIKALFAGQRGKVRFLVFHPAWGYFAQAYGLEQIAIEQEGKEPGPRELKRLIGQARELGLKVIFVQPQFSAQKARTIARSIGGQVVPIDPLAEDWADNLRQAAREIKAGLK
ncbi:MAG: zinc ABC transporter substrate-binding protein [Deltaproteobacteria bacterium]|nr:zinc ABC transporter substrate-binding protein [Deltaproteobacteria bacterium]